MYSQVYILQMVKDVYVTVTMIGQVHVVDFSVYCIRVSCVLC